MDYGNEAILNLQNSGIDSLVEQTRAGDERAFGRLVAELQPRVHRWALSYSMDPDEAEDIVQEVFVLVLRHLDKYRGHAALTTWLYRITGRAASRLRRTRQRRAVLASGPRGKPDREVYETDPGGRVDRERLGSLLRNLWQNLPERQRVVVDLVDLQGHTPAEAADMLELNPSTLRANLFKARKTLRGQFLMRHPDIAASYLRGSNELR
ncbi:MAG: RNA polymerase sigma factor [Gemmatimonadales bacterium]